MSKPNKVLIVDDLLVMDDVATFISNKYQEWEGMRERKRALWSEIQQYIFATDTSHTSNAKLPWSNKTTIPKLSQIRDNLHANYMASMFPKSRWFIWEGETKTDEDITKKEAIESYMSWATDRNEFLDEMSRLVLDFIDYGNVFVTVDWHDVTHEVVDTNGVKRKVGYVGPRPRRISPLDIVFNPISPDFQSAPKIVRSWITMGELKELLDRQSVDEEDLESSKELWSYLNSIREEVTNYQGVIETRSEHFNVAGFGNFENYLQSGTVEVLTFYGDIYHEGSQKYMRNMVVKVVDRHKIIYMKPNTSSFGHAPIYHAGWRMRPDNLWAMGPLDNLVGMQYRIDHLENMKSDVMDLITYPPLKIKGYVEPFVWEPFERIIVGDDGDVEMMSPDVQALQVNTEIAVLEQKMEEMAGSPREAMGIRSPGEKTAFEVQVLDNARSRIFQNKIALFERLIVENVLNAMLENAHRNMQPTNIRIFDEENKIPVFETLTPEDIVGVGRIKPIAARHFAEKATKIQNISQFLSSGVGSAPDVRIHFSGIKVARLFEELLELKNENIVTPFIGITEQADAQRIAQTSEEQVAMESQTPSGLTPDDFDPDMIVDEELEELDEQDETTTSDLDS